MEIIVTTKDELANLIYEAVRKAIGSQITLSIKKSTENIIADVAELTLKEKERENIILNVENACEYLGVKKSYIYQMTHS